MPASARRAARVERFHRAFVGMQVVHAHPDRMVFAQHAHQARGDALRQHRRHLRADADELDVRNLAQPAEDVVELLVGERERVAAGDQHVADCRRRADVVEHRFEAGIRGRQLAVADHARSRAVAAISRAEVEREEQHAIRIAMHETGHRAVAVFAQRIVRLARCAQKFAGHRNDGAAQRVVRVGRVEQAHVIRRDSQRQHRAAFDDRAAFIGRQLEQILELREVLDAVARLPAPVGPLRVGHHRIVRASEHADATAFARRSGTDFRAVEARVDVAVNVRRRAGRDVSD